MGQSFETLRKKALRAVKWAILLVAVYAIIGQRGFMSAQIAVAVPNNELDVINIKYIDGQIWLATTNGAFRVDNDRVRREPDQDLVVYDIERIGGRLWLGTTSGAYRVEPNGLKRIPDEDLVVLNISEIAGNIWLTTTRGAYRIDGEKAQRIPDIPLTINSIDYLDGKVWIATTTGAYRIDGEKQERLPDLNLDVVKIKQIGSEVWLATQLGAYRIDGNAMQRVPDLPLDVIDLNQIDGKIWLATHSGAYRIDRGYAQRIPDQEFVVEDVELIDGKIWLATHKGAYRIGDTEIERIPDEDLVVVSIRSVNGKIWLLTSTGAYRLQGTLAKRIPDLELLVRRIDSIDGKVWLPTNNGAYRVDEGVSITVVPQGIDSWWSSLVEHLFPGRVWVAGPVRPKISYSRVGDGKDPYPANSDKSFTVIMETTEDLKDKAKAERHYSPSDGFERSLTSGKTKIYTSVRDKWGNESESEASGLVVPGPAILPFLFALFWVALLSVTIALAPRSDFCHGLLMNPWVRKFGSFGLVPLAMTVLPFVRRHILQRYVLAIRADADFAETGRRYVVPSEEFFPDSFAKKIQWRRKLLLIGQSGIGKTAYLKFLTSSYITDHRYRSYLSNMIPLFLPIARYQGETLEMMIHAQLANYGRLTDKELTAWFIQQGGFLILIDGLNEVDETMRHKINTFVDQNWKANCLCISSQDSYPEFQGIEKEEVISLGPEHVNEILRRRLGVDRADQIIRELNAKTYDEYRVPQDLEFAIDLLKTGTSLPLSKHSLYESTLSPIYKSWIDEGRSDYPELLFRRAYEMLSQREPYFDSSEGAVPEQIRDRMIEKKFLIRRGEHYYFRHDLVRAYLAAKYFSPRWQSLLHSKETELDINWRPMLEFVVLERINAEEARSLLYSVLIKNKRVAGELFKWLRQGYPELCQPWADEFKRRYGELMLE